jgi:hypothetical protein
MRVSALALSLILLGLVLGCATSWNRYDVTSYNTIRDPGAEAYEAHVGQIEAMTNATMPPPPGLCAEAGYYFALLGHSEEAAAWFDREIEHYPKAAIFVNALRALVLPSTDAIESDEPVGTETDQAGGKKVTS